MTETKKILCIEDDPDCCEILEIILGDEEFEVVTCASSRSGLKLAKQGGFSAIILDYRLAEINGVEICREIRTYDQKTPIIFYTASAFLKDINAGLEAGANAYLVKPNDFGKIAETVKKFVQETTFLRFEKVGLRTNNKFTATRINTLLAG